MNDGNRQGGVGLARSILALAAVLGVVLAPLEVAGQGFGRNKVQYDRFDFRVLKTDHFDIHYYPEEGEAIEDLARMAERWYERLARSFQHEFEESKPLIIYADHPDFQQTNTLRGALGEGTGGVTESLKDRVIMPMTGSYWDTDHVLGHELVHEFQYNIAQSRRGGGLQGLSTLPLWMIEGMAEYLSVGRDAPLTAMWLRDAIRRDDFPTIRQMTRESRFFPYRFGQALWGYIGGEYGDDAVIQVFRRALRIGFQPAIGQVLGLSPDSLSAQWRRQVEQEYIPLMTNRTAPDELGTLLLAPSTGAPPKSVSPSLSPDGRYIAYLSLDIFEVDLVLADATTGKEIRSLGSADADTHTDALRYVEAAGGWSPDSRYFAYTVFAAGDNEIIVVDAETGQRQRRIKPEGLGAMNNPTWSPDGRYIAFTGFKGGISDLYLYELESDVVTQLTNDKYADFQPTFSPDGSTIAFASDRGASTSFDDLFFSSFQLSLLDVASQRVRVLPVFGEVRHSNPQYAPDGESLYFISDQDGFADVYEVDFADGEVRRITRGATGVSGFTDQSPALSVASRTGEIAFGVFTEFEFHVLTLPAGTLGEPVNIPANAAEARGRQIPPANPDRFSRVDEYLSDATTGLPLAGTFQVSAMDTYDPKLELDFIGQPTLGVGADRFGNYIGGGASAYFSDMLGDRFLGVALQAQGTFKDIGGQVSYVNLTKRWNWGVGVSRIPYQLIYQGQPTTAGGLIHIPQYRQRIFVSSASGQLAYPLSQTRRFEFGAGMVRYAYDVEIETLTCDLAFRCFDITREDAPELEADPLNLAQISAAYVGDNANFGFVSPVRGGRFRVEALATVGTESFTSALLDWRRYWQVDRDLTVAFRGLHYGRYGAVSDPTTFTGTGILTGSVIQPLFLGYETLIRGYAYESFSRSECDASGGVAAGLNACPVFDRLLGQRLAVMNFELRVPLLGVEQFGVFNFPYLPTELLLFADAGFAWNENADFNNLDWFSRDPGGRGPVYSAGVSARANILGFLIVEMYYAKPFQRPDKSWHWGFQLAPGW